MKKQFKENEKLTDKAFSRIVFTSVLAILVCLTCLCSTTYAWFSETVLSNGNSITVATKCELTVEVFDSSEELIAKVNIGKTKSIHLDSGIYTVKMTLPKGSASAYLMFSVGAEKYYTDYLAYNTGDTDKVLTFEISVLNETSVTLKPKWGIYSGESHIGNGGLVEDIGIVGRAVD